MGKCEVLRTSLSPSWITGNTWKLPSRTNYTPLLKKLPAALRLGWASKSMKALVLVAWLKPFPLITTSTPMAKIICFNNLNNLSLVAFVHMAGNLAA